MLALAVLPALFLSIFIYRKDTVEKEPLGTLAKAFFMGMVSCVPAVLLEMFLSAFDPQAPVLSGLWNGFVVAGFSEELCKLLLLSLAVWRSREFNEYFDGIVYACYVSLGFACVENIGYVFASGDLAAALSTGVVRALLSVPGHFLFGVVMGYYFGLAKFEPAKRERNLTKALLYPLVLHGTFDALLMIPESVAGPMQSVIAGVLFVAFVWFDIKLWKIGIRRMREMQQLSEQQSNDNEFFDDSADDNDLWNGGSNSGDNYPQDPFKQIDWNI